jgi:phosphoserine phosphatase
MWAPAKVEAPGRHKTNSPGGGMSIAVFLDVDNTLTTDFIQKQYATVLKCEAEYKTLEDQLQSKAINSGTFGKEIIKLFASKGFTKEEANAHFQDIRLQPGADALLNLSKVDKYLVSSGPSYYIDALAERYNIPEENRCRSIYGFSRQTGLIDSCVAVDEQYKADFVRTKQGKRKYAITIGVGDNPEFDGPFLAHCMIRLMTVETGKYVYIPNFNSVVQLIERLSEIPDTGIFDLGSGTISQLVKSISVNNWVWIISAFTAVFAIGVTIGSHLVTAIGSQLK